MNIRQLFPSAIIGVLRTSGNKLTRGIQGDLSQHIDEEFFSSEEALKFSPAAVVIASPASTHVQYAKLFLQNGTPVLIEKPLSNTTQDLLELLTLAEKKQVRAAVAYNLRYNSSLQFIRECLHSGTIGEVLSVRAEVGQYLPDWRPGVPYQQGVSASNALGGGALLELSHELDYLYWMFGLPDKVIAMGGKISALEIDVEDTVELCLHYKSPERLVNVHLDFIQRSPNRSCRFIGTLGTLVWNGIENSVKIFDAASGRWTNRTFADQDRNEMYLAEIIDFLSSTNPNTTKLPSLPDAYNVMAIIEAARESMKLGKQIEVKGYGQR
jgi:predicted dehydrogenase